MNFVLFKTGSYYEIQASFELTTVCKPGWPQTQSNPPASASKLLELQACVTVPGYVCGYSETQTNVKKSCHIKENDAKSIISKRQKYKTGLEI